MLAREKWQIKTIAVLEEVFKERERQVAQYGHNEDIVDGTGPDTRWALPASSNSAEVLEKMFREDYEDFEDETGAKVTYTSFGDNGPTDIQSQLEGARRPTWRSWGSRRSCSNSRRPRASSPCRPMCWPT